MLAKNSARFLTPTDCVWMGRVDCPFAVGRPTITSKLTNHLQSCPTHPPDESRKAVRSQNAHGPLLSSLSCFQQRGRLTVIALVLFRTSPAFPLVGVDCLIHSRVVCLCFPFNYSSSTMALHV